MTLFQLYLGGVLAGAMFLVAAAVFARSMWPAAETDFPVGYFLKWATAAVILWPVSPIILGIFGARIGRAVSVTTGKSSSELLDEHTELLHGEDE